MHLAAIVGDPACARDPELSNEVNVEGSRALVADARAAGVERLVFASTCSNYGRMADPTVPIDESGELRAGLALRRAEGRDREGAARGRPQRPQAHLPALRHRLRRGPPDALRPDRQRVHPRPLGRAAPRGVRRAFWRPYVHVRDAARAVRDRARRPGGAGRRPGVQRRPLGRELPQARPRGDHHRASSAAATWATCRATRTRATTRCRSSGSRTSSASSPEMRVPTGIVRARRRARAGALRRPVRRPLLQHLGRCRDLPLIPLFDVRLERRRDRGGRGHAALGLAHDGPAHAGVRGAVRRAPRREARAGARRAAPPRSTSPTWPRGSGPGDEVIVPAITFVATANAARYCGATPVLADVIGQHDLGIDPDDVAARITARTKAVCAVHFAGYAADVARLRELCDARGIALIEDAAHAPDATAGRQRSQAGRPRAGRRVQLLLEQGALLRRGRPAGPTDDDDVAEHVRQPPLALHDLRHLGPPPRPRRRLRRDSTWASTTAWTSRARRCSAPACPSWRTTSRHGAGWCTATGSCSPAWTA